MDDIREKKEEQIKALKEKAKKWRTDGLGNNSIELNPALLCCSNNGRLNILKAKKENQLSTVWRQQRGCLHAAVNTQQET